MNPTTILGILELITKLSGIARQGLPQSKPVAYGNDLLEVANAAIQLHAQETGRPIDEVIGQLHDLPPIGQ